MRTTRTATRARLAAPIAALAGAGLTLSACGGESNASSDDKSPDDGTYIAEIERGNGISLLTIEDSTVTREDTVCKIAFNTDNNEVETETTDGKLEESGQYVTWDNTNSTGQKLIKSKKHEDEGKIILGTNGTGYLPVDENEAQDEIQSLEEECPDMSG